MLRSVFRKTIWEQRRALVGWTIGILALVGFSLAFYPSIRANAAQFQSVIDQMPEGLRAVFLGEMTDITSPAGYLNGRLFASTLPVLYLVYGITAGTKAVAGEEEAHTLDLLLSMPIARRQVLFEKFGALASTLALLCVVLWVSLVVLDIPFGLDVAAGSLGAVTLHLFAFALFFGALGLALGAALGRRGLAAAIATGVAVASFLLSSIAPLSPATEWMKVLSPLHYYSGSTPLLHGVDPVHAGVLLVLTAICVAGGIWAFDRRDLRA